MALHCEIPVEDLLKHLIRRGKQTTDNYGELWSNLSDSVSRYKKTLPERSHPRVWKDAEATFAGVGLSGNLQFVDTPRGTELRFQLNPLKLDKSYRLARKYGADRLFIVGMPSLVRKDLPQSLKPDTLGVRNAVLDWLANAPQHFLGRNWRVFYTKAQERSLKSRKADSSGTNTISHRLFLFATDGFEIYSRLNPLFMKGKEPSTTIQEMLDWFIPFSQNQGEPTLKLFSRLQLGMDHVIATTCLTDLVSCEQYYTYYRLQATPNHIYV